MKEQKAISGAKAATMVSKMIFEIGAITAGLGDGIDTFKEEIDKLQAENQKLMEKIDTLEGKKNKKLVK